MLELGTILSAVTRPFQRRTKPGAAPGTLLADPEALPPKIHVIRYGPDELSEQELDDLGGLPELLTSETVTWVNVDGLGDAEVVRRLGEMFELHPLALEDTIHVHQRAKVEDYDRHLFMVARMVSLAEELETEQLSIFVGPNYVLTLQGGPPGDCLDPVRERLRTAHGRIRRSGTSYLAYAIVDAVIDGYFPVLERYGDELDRLDDEVASDNVPTTIPRIHHLRSELLHLRRAIWPHREAVNELMREHHKLITGDTRIYLRDCYDHTIQLIDILETYREMCSDLRDFYFTRLSLRANDIMKVLTVFATIFIPLTFITGVYGMNFKYMPELTFPHGYPIALGVMAGMGIGLTVWIWRRGWFGS